MFGGGGMGISMPGMGGVPPKKKKPAPERRTNEDEEPPTAPRVPMPGIAIPGMARTMSSESAATIGKDGEDNYEKQAAAPSVSKGRYPSPTRPAPLPPSRLKLPRREYESEHMCAFDPVPVLRWRLASDGAGAESYRHSRTSHSTQDKDSWDRCSKAMTRKPLSPFQTPQLRFTTSLTYSSPSGYLSQQSALRWVLGSLEFALLFLYSV